MIASSPTVYLPSLPSLSSEDLALYKNIHTAHLDLVEKLAEAGFRVEDIDGERTWLKNMMQHAQRSDAFIFPPMTWLDETHPRFQAEAAQRWFEFFSLVTGVHVGSKEKYSKEGKSKPCVVIDPDGQWKLVTDLLDDLKEKGMFSSKVDDIVHVVGAGSDVADYAGRNSAAVTSLKRITEEKKGKERSQIRSRFSADHVFKPFRHDMHRHPFGVAMFGSATTNEPSYIEATRQLAGMVGQRGWRLSTGAGIGGCMGAMDTGFSEGKEEFNRRYPKTRYQPSHIGVSTQPILRLEGPPDGLDQLIITDNIYDRMRIILKGKKAEDPLQRARDATKVIFVTPGGAGTLHEFATMMQLTTGGTMMEGRKVVLLNMPSRLDPQKGFWDKLIATARKLGFDKHFEVAKTPQEAIGIADREYQKWLERHPEERDLPHPALNSNPTGRTGGSRVSEG